MTQKEYAIIQLPCSVSKGSMILIEKELSAQVKRGGIDYLLDVGKAKLAPSETIGLIVSLYKEVLKAKGNLTSRLSSI